MSYPALKGLAPLACMPSHVDAELLESEGIAALSQAGTIFVTTHDSIAVGHPKWVARVGLCLVPAILSCTVALQREVLQ